MRKFKITHILYYILLNSTDLHQCLRHQTAKLTNEHVKQNQLVHNPYPGSYKGKKKKVRLKLK